MKISRQRTAVKHEFKLYELHIYDIRVQWFVRETHTNVFQFNDIPLEGVLQPVLEIDEIRNLSVLLCSERANNEVRGLDKRRTSGPQHDGETNLLRACQVYLTRL